MNFIVLQFSLAFDFTSLYFFVALDMYILKFKALV